MNQPLVDSGWRYAAFRIFVSINNQSDQSTIPLPFLPATSRKPPFSPCPDA